MKKKILGGIAVLAVTAVAAWNVNFNSQKNDMTDVSLANIEALADEETSEDVYSSKKTETVVEEEVMVNGKTCRRSTRTITCEGIGKIVCIEHFFTVTSC